MTRTAILFIHGILGKPDYFDFLMPSVPSDITVERILLDGHGGRVRDFSEAAMSTWREQVSRAVAALSKVHERIIIAAHSMGTLFAIQEAVAGHADCLFLLNPPLRLRLTRRFFSTPVEILRNRITPDDLITQAACDAYSIEYDANILHYFGWIPRYLELFAEIARTRRIMPQLTVPAIVFLSAHDEMVSPDSCKYFKHPTSKIIHLAESGHYYYTDDDKHTIISEFATMLNVDK